MSDDPIRPGGALEGRLFRGFLRHLSDAREPRPGERIGAWKIARELGRGGSGVVFLADRADGAYTQRVALKWLRGDRPVPGGGAVLERERELLASLDHPNIARLIDGGATDDGMRWFAMDFAPGQTIDRAAADMTRARRLALVRTLCRAVHHAHTRGLIHGDIKPSNVLVDERARPRLVDFGISRLRQGGPGGSYGLTPDYASPEQRAGEDLTTASDIWQLGHMLEDLLRPVRIPADVRAIVRRATQHAPAARYASAEAMAADIDAWLARRPVAARGGGPVYRLVRRVQRNRALSAVAALALAVILGGGGWMTWQLALERDHARAEADRAEAALAETERTLARARALSAFLVDLFEATRPDRPRDELPTTAEILERGAERALDPDSAPAAERIDMLATIGQVYRSRARFPEAEPLLEAAVALAREHPELAPTARARAFERRARLTMAAGGSLNEAEALLLEAESALAEAPSAWDLRVRVGITRTWVERHRGRHDRALALIESVRQALPAEAGLDAATRAGLYDSLAGLHYANGDLDRASRYRDRALAAFRRLPQGETGQGYVVSLANSVGLEHARGRFGEAERRARRALELYDRIYPEPVDYRAALRRTLAGVLLTRGRIEAAFASLRAYGDEYARFTGREPGEWPLYYSHRGAFRVRLGELERALADFRRAEELLRRQGGFDRRLHEVIDLLLAGTLCRAGQGAAGAQRLAGIQGVDRLKAKPRTHAQWLEARAACDLAAGRADQALARIDEALAREDRPGHLVHSADRRLLKARVLERLERPDEAERVLARADRAFVEAGLDDHPMRERIRGR
jgi:tetratricopeptide (TPR) repeat protein